MSTIVSCSEIIEFVLSEWEETCYHGTGHGSKTIIDNDTVHMHTITLDNFTKDAFDIREQYQAPKSPYRSYYWLSFNYLTLSTHCREVKKDMVVFPSVVLSPKWWPNALKSSPFPIGRSKYIFYCCNAFDVNGDYSVFEYFAIDNSTKKGYYWKTISDFTPANDIGKCYYDWDKH